MSVLSLPFPTIDPVLIEIGPFALRWYALAYVVGIFLGWWYAKRLVANQRLWGPEGAPMKPADIDDFVVWATLGIILGGPYNSGILATGAIPGAKYNYDDAPPEILERVRKIEAVCAAHDTRLIAAALQFVLGHPSVKTVIPGGVNAREVNSNVELLETPIPDGLWSDLRSEGLIRPDAPLPSEARHAA